MFKKYSINFVLFLFFLLFLIINSYSDDKKNVLILNSYHEGYKWTDEMMRGILDKLEFKKHDKKFYIEYLGTKWIFDENYFEQTNIYYKNKYKNISIDMIIATDNDAFNFLAKYRDNIFGKIPVVFCGVNWFSRNDYKDFSLYTGVNEDADIEENFELMLKLHPNVKNIYFIADVTTTGIIVHEKMHNVLLSQPNVKKHNSTEIILKTPKYKDKVSIHCMHDMAIENILEKISTISDDSLVFITIFHKDINGKLLEYYDIAELVSKNSKVPVYGLWDFHLGHGILGGMLTSGYAQGEAAGEITSRILKGESIESIPVLEKSPNRFIFDYNVMQKFGIKKSSLPERSLILNEPISFYSLNKYFVCSVSLGLIILSFAVVLLLVNISLRKKAEMATLKLNERYKSVLKAAIGFSIIGTNKNGLIKVFNEGAELMLGYRADEVIDKMYMTEVHDKHEIELMAKELNSTADFNTLIVNVQENKTETREWKYVRKDGSIFPVQLSITTRKDSKDNVIGFLGIAIDITERKRIEKELSEHREQLENLVESRTSELKKTYDNLKNMQKQLLQAEKMATIGQLAAGVAHEINNPSGFVISNLNTLKRYIDDIKAVFEKYLKMENMIKEISDNKFAHFLQELNEVKNTHDFDFILSDLVNLTDESLEGMKRIQRIVADLKTFSHADKNNFEDADIHEIIQLALNLSWNEIKYKAEVIKEFDESIPKIRCYSQQLAQVFLNILVNAVHAIADKGSIRIKTFLEGKMVAVSIEDNGCGMSEETCKHIFDPFFTTKPVGKGTGLGLSIANNIIQKHNGEIDVKTILGKGTVFTIKIPFY